MLTFEDVKNNSDIKTYISCADRVMSAIRFTEHGFAHAGITSSTASDILERLGYDKRTVELTRIAAYIHDIGNAVNRSDHAQSGAVMAFSLLSAMKGEISADETCQIVSAIGHHDEGSGGPVSAISAALILADKSDVRRSRVREGANVGRDIHDRVNYAVHSSALNLDPAAKIIVLSLKIDTKISAVMDYFEIFLSRMLMCRKAAEYLGLEFELEINDTRLL